ncbi:MAG: hypothetical protein ACI915_002971 [Gammaproteobacteria bacterium]|jgi:hypothetical protein
MFELSSSRDYPKVHRNAERGFYLSPDGVRRRTHRCRSRMNVHDLHEVTNAQREFSDRSWMARATLNLSRIAQDEVAL